MLRHRFRKRRVSNSPQDNVTRLLRRAADGESAAAHELLPLVYRELRELAASFFIHERVNHTLQPTALVHEAYVRLVASTAMRWESRQQFFVVAARAMRNILVDHARGRNRAKRGGGWDRKTLDGVAGGMTALDQTDLLALDEALTRLDEFDPTKAKLVELRFFAGMSSEDAARVLGVSRSTAAEQWRMARAWLHRELKEDGA
jgi:RNA polymerase sigma-70 factor (ECF subfamily)